MSTRLSCEHSRIHDEYGVALSGSRFPRARAVYASDSPKDSLHAARRTLSLCAGIVILTLCGRIAVGATVPVIDIDRTLNQVVEEQVGVSTGIRAKLEVYDPSAVIEYRLPPGRWAWTGISARPAGLPEAHQVAQIAAGRAHGIALCHDGSVRCWGENDQGQCAVPSDLPSVRSVHASGDNTYVVTTDGTVHAWGGRVVLPSSLGAVAQLAVGSEHCLAVLADGNVVGWGADGYGQATVPADIGHVVQLAVGASFSLALGRDGEVRYWGQPSGPVSRLPGDLVDVVAIAAGRDHALALKRDGTVVSWGNDRHFPSDLTGITAIAAGAAISIAMTNDHEVVCWGENCDAMPHADLPARAIAAGEYVIAVRGNAFAIDAVSGRQAFVLQPSDDGLAVDVVTGELAPDYEERNNYSIIVTASVENGPTGVGVFGCAITNAMEFDLVDGDPALDQVLEGAPPETLVGITVEPEMATSGEVAFSLMPSRVIASWHSGPLMQPSPADDLDAPIVIAAGGGNAAALQADGELRIWDQSGDLSAIPPGAAGAVDVALGRSHALVLRHDGSVYAWGDNSAGQCIVPAGLPPVQAVAAGGWTSAALDLAGQVHVWGLLGPCPVGAPAKVVSVSVGDHHALAVVDEGEGEPGFVVAWGEDWYGETVVPEDLGPVVAVAAGGNHSLALTTTGQVRAWGDNAQGQCDVPPGLDSVVGIAANDGSCFALLADGTWAAWGQTTIQAGERGPIRSLAVNSNQVITLAGSDPRLAIDSSTGVISTTAELDHEEFPQVVAIVEADDGRGQARARFTVGVGDRDEPLLNMSDIDQAANAIAENAAPGSLVGITVRAYDPEGQAITYSLSDDAGGRFAINPLSGEVFVKGRLDHETAPALAITINASCGVGGLELAGIIAVLDVAEAVGPISDVDPLAERIAEDAAIGTAVGFTARAVDPDGGAVSYALGGDRVWSWGSTTAVPAMSAGWVAAAAGLDFSVALTGGGRVHAWGRNDNGQATVPTGLAEVIAIAAGHHHALALRADGSVCAWGSDARGQASVPADLGQVVAIAAGAWHSVALQVDGTIRAWGADDFLQVSGCDGNGVFTQVAAGSMHTLALDADGGVHAWGQTAHGQCAVPADLPPAIALAAGSLHSLALHADGSLSAWGWNADGQCAVPAVSDAVAIAAGDRHSLALRVGGSVTRWGAGDQQQLSLPAGMRLVTAVAAGATHSVALSSGGGCFAIDAQTGELTLAAPLDRDRAVAHRVPVVASDTHSSSAIVVTIPVGPPEPIPERRVAICDLPGYVWDHVCESCSLTGFLALTPQTQGQTVLEPLDPAADHLFQAVPVLDD